VRIGDAVTVRRQGLAWDVVVTGIADRRGSATIAASLYRESAESAAAREAEEATRRAAFQSRPTFPGRPTKRQRRKLADFLDEP